MSRAARQSFCEGGTSIAADITATSLATDQGKRSRNVCNESHSIAGADAQALLQPPHASQSLAHVAVGQPAKRV